MASLERSWKANVYRGELGMDKRGLTVLLAVAGALSLGLAAWVVTERSGRRQAEDAAANLEDRFRAQGGALERALVDVKGTVARLGATQAELRDLQKNFQAEVLSRREEADRQALEKSALSEQVKQQERQVQEKEGKVAELTGSLTQAQEEQRKVLGALASEREDAKVLAKALHQELDAAKASSRQSADALRKSREAAQALQDDLKRTVGLARKEEDENTRLAQDLQRSTAERDAAAWSSQRAQLSLEQAVNLLRIRDYELRNLRDQHSRMQQDLEKQIQLVRQQELTILALKAELAKLKKPTP